MGLTNLESDVWGQRPPQGLPRCTAFRPTNFWGHISAWLLRPIGTEIQSGVYDKEASMVIRRGYEGEGGFQYLVTRIGRIRDGEEVLFFKNPHLCHFWRRRRS